MTRQRKAAMWVIGLVLGLFAIRIALPMIQQPDDQKLVLEALAESIQASKEGRPGGVLDKLSDKFKVNNTEPGTRQQIADFIRNNKPDVMIDNQHVQFFGDEARIVSPVKVQASFLGQQISRTLKTATIIFKKEDAMDYLIIPTRKWKLTDVQVPDDVAAEFIQ